VACAPRLRRGMLGTAASLRCDSTAADCDVRELANPVRCERTSDGIETRTSPRIPRGSASVDGGLSSRDETGALPVRGTKCRAAHGGQPVSKSGEQRSIRWLGAKGDVQKSARVPCKQAHSERYRASPPLLTSVRSGLRPTCSRPIVRTTAWYAVLSGAIPDGSSSLAVAHLVPVGAKAQRGPGSRSEGSRAPKAEG
jgi:hypothetical protein